MLIVGLCCEDEGVDDCGEGEHSRKHAHPNPEFEDAGVACCLRLGEERQYRTSMIERW